MKVRKIESKAVEEKRRKKNQRILSLVMILILTGGVFGIIVSTFGSSNFQDFYNKKITINEREFIEEQGFWLTENPKITERYLSFVYLPNQTLTGDVNITNINIDFSRETLYIDSNSPEILSGVYRNFNDIVLRVQPGCIDEHDCEANSPLKSCVDNIIIVREGNKTTITQEENCIYITSKQEDLLKTTEEFIYRYYKIK